MWSALWVRRRLHVWALWVRRRLPLTHLSPPRWKGMGTGRGHDDATAALPAVGSSAGAGAGMGACCLEYQGVGVLFVRFSPPLLL